MTGRRGVRGAGARNIDTQDVEARGANSRSTGAADTDRRGADTRETDTEDTEARGTGAHYNDVLQTDARTASARNTGTLDAEVTGATARNTDRTDADSSASNSSIMTTIDTTGTAPLDDDKELQAIKLSRQTEKIARFESHRDFLATCIRDRIIPLNFRIEVEPSIGNHDDKFLASWYTKVEKLSLELMTDTVNFCNETIAKAETEAKSLDQALRTTTPTEEYTEIKTIINNYNEQKKIELQKAKRAKHRKLRWNITNGQRKQQQQQTQPILQPRQQLLRQQRQQQQQQQQQPPLSTYRQRTERGHINTAPSTAMPNERQQRAIDGDESATPKEQRRRRKDTQIRTYAEILKPKVTRRPTPTPSSNTPFQETTTTSQKNQSSP